MDCGRSLMMKWKMRKSRRKRKEKMERRKIMVWMEVEINRR